MTPAASAPGRLRVAAVFAALAVLFGVGVAAAATLGWPGFDPAGTDTGTRTPGTLLPGALVRSALILAGQACFAVAAALVLRDIRPAARWAPWVFLGALVGALAALQLFVAAFGAGFGAADDGVPADPITRLAVPALAASLVGFAIAVGALVAALHRGQGASRLLTAAAAGLVGAAPAVLFFVTAPLQSVWLPAALGVWILVRLRRGTRQPSAAAPAGDRSSSRLVRPLSGAAAGVVAAAWALGAVVATASAGTGLATAALGYAAAAAQLAALPLFLAVVALLRTAGRAPAATAPLPAGLTAAGIAAGSVVALAGAAPDGTALLIGAAISGASLGLWAAALAAGVFPHPFARFVVGLGTVAAGMAAWYLLVVATGALALGLLAGVVLFLGPWRLGGLSRAPAAASR